MITNTAALVVLLAGSLPIIRARICLTNETVPLYGDMHSLTLTSPDQLIPLNDCETLIGNFKIDKGFSGSLVLNSVTNFTGRILGDLDADNRGLEAIEMLNLQTIMDIRTYGIWGLRTIQMPRLESIAWQLDITQGAEDSWMDFSALKTVNMISMAGTWTNVSFPALETVNSSFWIVTDPSGEVVGDRTDSVDIDLPALVKVRDLVIKGHIRSLSTPKLEALGEPEYIAIPKEVTQGGLSVVSNHTDMPGVFLPSLQELHGRLTLDGHISTIDLYGLKDTDATITVNATSPVKIYSALEQAGEIDLRGDLAVVNFTNLIRAEKLLINSDIEVQCSASLIHAYRNINYPDQTSFCDAESLALAGETLYTHNTTQTPSPSSTPTAYYPTETPSSGGRKLGAGAEAAIAIAAIVGGGFLIGSFIIIRHRNKKHSQSAAAAAAAAAATTVGPTASTANPDDANTEDLPRHWEDESPPQYSREPEKTT